MRLCDIPEVTTISYVGDVGITVELCKFADYEGLKFF